MLHRSALDDEARPPHPRQPSGSPTEPPSVPPPGRPDSRNRIVKPSGAVTSKGLDVVTDNVPGLHPDGLKTTSPVKEGLGSVNRWSQSTTSSRSLSEYTGHRRGSSKMSMPGHSPRRGPGLGELPELSLPELRASEMFSIDSVSPHMDLSFTASSHVSQNSTNGSRNATPSYLSDHNGARTSERAGSSSADGEVDSDARQNGQSQKAMLSKALQKANTAVLLDNAANFEGAMEAYTDACRLLQLVMLQSNGGDEEKLKLQEIVGPRRSIHRAL